MEKPGSYHLNQGSKVNIITNGKKRQYAPPDVIHQKGHNIISVVLLPKMPNLNLITSKRLKNSN